jgi:hypothetical protein
MTMASTITFSDVTKCSLVNVFLPQWPKFDPRSGHVGFVVHSDTGTSVFSANSDSTNQFIFINPPIINSISLDTVIIIK